MMRTRRPRGIDKRVMEVLLDVINDIADMLRRKVGIESTPRGRFNDRFIMFRANGCFHIRTKQQTTQASLNYSSRMLSCRDRMPCPTPQLATLGGDAGKSRHEAVRESRSK